MKQKRHSKTRVRNVVVLGVMVVGLSAAMVGLTNIVHQITDSTLSKTPNAILASAGVSEAELVRLPVMYYDQRMDECVNMYNTNMKDELEARQFEWSECGYYNGKIEHGLVSYELDEQYLPIATKGELLPNRGVDMTRWYNAVDGKSAGYAGTIGLEYHSDSAEFLYNDDSFYPLDEVEFSKGDATNRDGHNHLFTMGFAVPFTVLASGEESFTLKADDDTFVYVDDNLVIDMGGVHEATVGRFAILENGEVYTGVGNEMLAYSGVNVKAGEGAMIRIFHADRDSQESIFSLKIIGMNLSVTDVELADGDDGVQIAYDPNDPSYVPPLGESAVSRPDTTKGMVLLATVEGVAVLVMAMGVAYVVRYAMRDKTK